MKMRFAIIAIAVVIAGCAHNAAVAPVLPGPPARVIAPIIAAFDYQKSLDMIGPGTATLRGSALLRQSGGGVVTCAGNKVLLIPATPYAEERINFIYGPTQTGLVDPDLPPPLFEPNPPEYWKAMRYSLCDAQGYFEFDGVKAGKYFVTTNVSWTVGYLKQGGNLLGPVVIAEGEKRTVILSAP